MSAATQGSGGPNGPPHPPPSGGGGNDRDRSGKRSGSSPGNSRGRKRRRSNRTGRPLGQHERMFILNIWAMLSPDARRSLLEMLSGMLGETPAASSVEDSATVQQQVSEQPRGPRQRAWAREVLRDVPLFSEFGQLTTAQRRTDTRGIPHLLSISMGVVARGRRQGVSDAEISQAIVDNLGNPDALRDLYIVEGPPAQDEDVAMAQPGENAEEENAADSSGNPPADP